MASGAGVGHDEEVVEDEEEEDSVDIMEATPTPSSPGYVMELFPLADYLLFPDCEMFSRFLLRAKYKADRQNERGSCK